MLLQDFAAVFGTVVFSLAGAFCVLVVARSAGIFWILALTGIGVHRTFRIFTSAGTRPVRDFLRGLELDAVSVGIDKIAGTHNGKGIVLRVMLVQNLCDLLFQECLNLLVTPAGKGPVGLAPQVLIDLLQNRGYLRAAAFTVIGPAVFLLSEGMPYGGTGRFNP